MSGQPPEDRFLKSAYQVRSAAETRALYDQWADTYDIELTRENDYAQPRRCADMLERFQPDLSGTVLDVGCGTGLSGGALLEHGYRKIDGCDLSPGMLAKAKQTGIYGRLFEANLNEPKMDALPAYYASAVAVGVFSFGHVGPDALDDILRVMKPGGILVIGLNEHFYDEGSLTAKLIALSGAGRIDRLAEEHGDHITGAGLTGWVIAVRKSRSEAEAQA